MKNHTNRIILPSKFACGIILKWLKSPFTPVQATQEIGWFFNNRFIAWKAKVKKQNGKNAIPLYKRLTSSTEFQGFNGSAEFFMTPIIKKMDPDYKSNGNIKWNFTKFLIDREGNIVQRYEPTAKTDDIKEKIKVIL